MNTWAHLEAAAGNLGDKDTPAQYSARWILRWAWEHNRVQLCTKRNMDLWAKLEFEAANLGNSEAPGEFSASWIIQRRDRQKSL